MGRVEIARFVDRDCADLAVAFLRLHRISVATLDCRGYKSEAYVKLLVRADRAALAYSLLRKAYAGAFDDGYPGASERISEAAIALTRGLHGSGYKGANPAWLNVLPIVAIAVLLMLPTAVEVVRGLTTGR